MKFSKKKQFVLTNFTLKSVFIFNAIYAVLIIHLLYIKRRAKAIYIIGLTRGQAKMCGFLTVIGLI
jgi:hypothetical protein